MCLFLLISRLVSFNCCALLIPEFSGKTTPSLSSHVFYGITNLVCLFVCSEMTHYRELAGPELVDQVGLELRDHPASASQVLGFKGMHHHAWLPRSISSLCVGCTLEKEEALGCSWVET